MPSFRRQSLTAYAQPLCETVADLPVPQGTEVLVRVERCGVCHSDLHLQDGYFSLGVALGVFHLDQCAGGRDRHGHQDQERNRRPDDLDRGAFVPGGGLVAAVLAMRHDRIEHRPEHHHADHHADPHDQHVQIVKLVADGGDRFREIEPVFGDGEGGNEERRDTANQASPQCGARALAASGHNLCVSQWS